LALLPVDHALDAAEKLRLAFTGKLAPAGFPDRSASVGIAFIHHMQPLESALRAARDARERAQKDYGRNALVVEVFRRSGERRSVGMNWTYPGFPLPSLTTIVQVQAAIATGDLSGRIAYDVDRTAPILAGGDDPAHRVPPEAQQAELSRLFKRRAKEEKSAQATAAKLAVSLAALAGQVGWREIAGWLGLARFLAQAGGEE
jgi:CRISPR-associated protein Cmr2